MFNFFGSLQTVQVSSNGTISVWTALLNVSIPIPNMSNQGVNDKIKKILSNEQMEKWLSTYCLQSTVPKNCPKLQWTSFTLQSLKNTVSVEKQVKDSHE